MGRQHQQIDNIGREQEEGLAASRRDREQLEGPVGNYIFEEIISPNSLLRSDRFARSKLKVADGHQEEMARVSRQQSGRENRPNSSSSGEFQVIRSHRIDAPNITQRRDIAATSTDFRYNNVRKRGKAPVKARPTLPATTSKPVVGQQRNGQQYGKKQLPIRETKASPHRMGSPSLFSDVTGFQTDSAAQSHNVQNKPSCGLLLADSGITGQSNGPLLSQSPLRPGSASLPTISSGHFQQSPMRSRPLNNRVSPDRSAIKVSELEPSFQTDTWSSRCCNLTQQIVDHLRRWNQGLSDGQISTSPIKAGPDHLWKSSFGEWADDKQILQDKSDFDARGGA